MMGEELMGWRFKLGSLTMRRGFRCEFFLGVSVLTLETFILGGGVVTFASFVFRSGFWRFDSGSIELSFEILRLGVGMIVAQEKLMDIEMFRQRFGGM